jgi:hypothetical protein
VIALCHADLTSLAPIPLAMFLARLRAHGAPLGPRVADPGAAPGICLWFTPFDAALARAPALRSRLVVVCEDFGPEPVDAEAARAEAGLLGLVEPEAWSRVQGGLYVGGGLYGDPQVAAAAGLAPLSHLGLQPPGARAPLEATLARFLAAADSPG